MSRLVAVGHDVMEDLQIPKAAIRDYSVYMDCMYIDRRRLLRHIHRARSFPCAKPLRAWWLAKLGRLERQA